MARNQPPPFPDDLRALWDQVRTTFELEDTSSLGEAFRRTATLALEQRQRAIEEGWERDEYDG